MPNIAAATKLNVIQCQLLRYVDKGTTYSMIPRSTVEDMLKSIREVEIELRGLKQVEDNSY